MKRFRNILVATCKVTSNDALSMALDRAAALAESNQASLKVIDVLEELPGDVSKLYKSVSRPKLRKKLIEYRLSILDELVARLRETGMQVEIKVLVGTPFIEIIREIMRDRHDLLIKPATDSGSHKTILFTSTDMHLIRECPCAVWITKPTKARKYARILAAVDPDPGDEEKSRMNAKILEMSTSLAESEKSELHIVHAWVLYEEALLKLLIGNAERMARDTRVCHQEWLDELLQNHTLARERTHVHLLEGKARDVIPMVAERENVELVVMGTLAGTGLPGRLIGHTAEDVLNRVDCSVLTIKPEGFVSPVKLE